MKKISCSVTNCAHNCQDTCYANRVNIGGQGAKNTEETCCGSFLDKRHYSILINNASEGKNSSNACDCLICDVATCTYNNNKLCNADVIQVSGENVNLYIETKCSTFKQK